MPNTKVVNDMNQFAEWCYGSSGYCKDLGGNACLKYRDPEYNRGRLEKTFSNI
jgi:hypothetical protein